MTTAALLPMYSQHALWLHPSEIKVYSLLNRIVTRRKDSLPLWLEILAYHIICDNYLFSYRCLVLLVRLKQAKKLKLAILVQISLKIHFTYA